MHNLFGVLILRYELSSHTNSLCAIYSGGVEKSTKSPARKHCNIWTWIYSFPYTTHKTLPRTHINLHGHTLLLLPGISLAYWFRYLPIISLPFRRSTIFWLLAVEWLLLLYYKTQVVSTTCLDVNKHTGCLH